MWRKIGWAAVAAIGVALGQSELFAAAEAVAPLGLSTESAVFAGAPSQSLSTESAAAAAFLRAAESLYAAAVKGQDDTVRARLLETERSLRALPMQRIGSAEGIEALARSVARFKRSAASVSGDDLNWTDAAAEIRLAADALVHPDKPLWHAYRAVLQQDIDTLAAALSESGAGTGAKAPLQRLQRHYSLIRTSALLRSETFAAERADSVLRYAQRITSSPSTDASLIRDLIPSLREAMDGLFPGSGRERSAFVPPVAGPPWGWSAIMGAFIVTVLSWAGWIRYRGAYRVTPRETLRPEHRERR